MNRKLSNIGVFSRGVVDGRLLESELMSKIYGILKELGFRETMWQFVYVGQLAGLVLPFNGGKNEIHVRFYGNRVFSEYEIGRAYLSHFTGVQYNANDYVLNLISEKLTGKEIDELKILIRCDQQAVDEREMQKWDGKQDYYEDSRAKQRRASAIFALLALTLLYDSSWKALLIVLMCIVTMGFLSFGLPLWALALPIISTYFLYKKLPSQGNP
jgi:hypothetical protein